MSRLRRDRVRPISHRYYTRSGALIHKHRKLIHIASKCYAPNVTTTIDLPDLDLDRTSELIATEDEAQFRHSRN